MCIYITAIFTGLFIFFLAKNKSLGNDSEEHVVERKREIKRETGFVC